MDELIENKPDDADIGSQQEEASASDANAAEQPEQEIKNESQIVNESDENNAAALSDVEVTEHTASLWKYFPVPQNEPEPFPEYLNYTTEYPKSSVIAARVRGKKHKHEGTNCDDWFETANYEDITIAAVSDGAGSKKLSRIGARDSCRAAVGYLVRAFKECFSTGSELRTDLALELSDTGFINACGTLAGIVQKSVEKAYNAVETACFSRALDENYEKVLKRPVQFKDFSSTLLVTVIIPVNENTKEQLVISCQIGDGLIALFNTNGSFENSIKLMGEPDSGDFSGETDFLTSDQTKNPEALKMRTRISRCNANMLLMMTDGVSDDYYPYSVNIRRLYFDLIVNNILESSQNTSADSDVNAENMQIIKKIPDPISYPWVNDGNIRIALQYTKRICENTGLSLENLWNDNAPLILAGKEITVTTALADKSERLKIWLDNYVERGSFDDRTLVIVQM